MPDPHGHVSIASLARRMLTGRLSRHPERYLEVFRIIRRYKLHHIIAELGPFSHSHAGEDEDPYITALARLQGAVAPVPGDRRTRIVEYELGAPLSDLFEWFDVEPLATASMAQVHRPVLRDGQEVAIKVQRPGVRERIEIDIEMLRELAALATRFSKLGSRYGLRQTVRELEHSLSQELDFRQEADNTRIISSLIAGFEHLTTPEVRSEYTSARVLTLSFMHGRHLESLTSGGVGADRCSGCRPRPAFGLPQAGRIDGIFHCDPHPGNILLTDDGRLALMDFGMVGRFDAGQKDSIILLLLAFSERLGERAAETYLHKVELPRDFDRRAFTQDVSALVSRYHDLSGGRMALGTALLDLTRVANDHQTPVPTSLTLLAKTLLNLDGTIRVLSPELDPVGLVRDYMQEVRRARGGGGTDASAQRGHAVSQHTAELADHRRRLRRRLPGPQRPGTRLGEGRTRETLLSPPSTEEGPGERT